VDRVIAVADWLPNVPGQASAAFYQSFRQRFAKPSEDYVHVRMQLMVEALAQAVRDLAARRGLNRQLIDELRSKMGVAGASERAAHLMLELLR
jgi:hypothetical protein